MRCNKGELFNGALASCLVVATAVFMLVTTPSPAHADEAEELFNACTAFKFNDDDDARRAINSCNRLIERYSAELSRDKLGKVYDRRGDAKRELEQYSSAVSDYRRAIELGNRDAYFSLGGAYLDGHGVPKDERRGVELMKRACDLGASMSCLYLKYILKVDVDIQ